MSAYDSLKPWEQQFIDYYVANASTPNATAAVRAVRPNVARPDVMATKLMKREDIQSAIMERMTRRRELIELDEKWVLDRLRKVVDRCMQQEAVLDREGEPTGEFRFDASGANRALELIGKHFAMWRDRQEHTGANGGPIQTVSRVELVPLLSEPSE